MYLPTPVGPVRMSLVPGDGTLRLAEDIPPFRDNRTEVGWAELKLLWSLEPRRSAKHLYACPSEIAYPHPKRTIRIEDICARDGDSAMILPDWTRAEEVSSLKQRGCYKSHDCASSVAKPLSLSRLSGM